METEQPGAQDTQPHLPTETPLAEQPGARVTRRAFLRGAAAVGLTSVVGASFLAAYARLEGIPVNVPWESENDMLSTTSGSPSVKRIIFLHQSTGAELIRDGNVRGLLRQRAPDIQFWDYGFNPPDLGSVVRGMIRRPSLMPNYYYGLGDAAGKRHGTSFQVVNTDPDGLAWMFGQPVSAPPTNAISHLLQFDVIAFKSCFTIFPIQSKEQLARYKQGYRVVRDVLERHPDKLFIPLTPPPLRASLCTTEQAARARQFAQWIMSEGFHGGLANVIPFDLFDALAVPDTGMMQANTLRPEYCRPDVYDSHPNLLANRAVAGLWVSSLVNTVEQTLRSAPYRVDMVGR